MKDGTITSDDQEILERWYRHFDKLLNQEIGWEKGEENESEVEEDQQSSKLFKNYSGSPSFEEVRKEFQKLKNNKSTITDQIPAELFKYGGRKLKQWLYEIVRKAWMNEEITYEWKEGIICPVHKKGDQMVCDNYRGILLLNLGYKVISTGLSRLLSAV